MQTAETSPTIGPQPANVSTTLTPSCEGRPIRKLSATVGSVPPNDVATWGDRLSRCEGSTQMPKSSPTLLAGLNWKRRGLVSILERLHRGDKLDVVVAHRDRLARFGFELIEWLVQQNGGRVVVLNQQDASPECELTEDLLAILHTFSFRMHGLRRYRTAIAADTGLSELGPEVSDCDLDGRQPVELQPDG